MASSQSAHQGDDVSSTPASPKSAAVPLDRSITWGGSQEPPAEQPPPRERRVSFHSSVSQPKQLQMLRRTSSHRQPSPAPNPHSIVAHDDDDDDAGGPHESSPMLDGTDPSVKRNYSTSSGRDNGAPTERIISDRRSSRRSSRDYQDSPSWWKRTLEKYGSVELENKGSVARDHLALERTFLAWLRTSLSFASIGIAITQLFRLNTSIKQSSTTGVVTGNTDESSIPLHHVGKPLGATFLGIGILVLLLGTHRYFESQHYVILGRFPASRASVLIVTISAAALIISCLVVVLIKAPTGSN